MQVPLLGEIAVCDAMRRRCSPERVMNRTCSTFVEAQIPEPEKQK